jgi:hypothetical protein
MAVPACTVDEFVAGSESPPQVIKIDVEGGESEVLKGATAVLRTYRPALLVEVHTSSQCEAVTAILESVSYQMRWAVPPEGFPRQCFAAAGSHF